MSEDFPVQLAGLRVGSRLAGYRIEAQLGAGGMAVVFRAHDERLKRPVALKVFAPATAADRAARQRFIDESHAAAAVDHPHIIPIYDADEVGGLLFIAMRLVRGGDLRGLLEREGVLPPARAAGIVSQVASALDAAHGADLVHRDVKPANILLAAPAGEADYVYLSDFGMSKDVTRPTSLTGTGQFLGTPDYAAPEQCRGVELVKGSDYGLVVVGATTAGQNMAYVSTDTGATWRPTEPLGGTSDIEIESATVGSHGTVIAVGSAGQHVVFIKTSPVP